MGISWNICFVDIPIVKICLKGGKNKMKKLIMLFLVGVISIMFAGLVEAHINGTWKTPLTGGTADLISGATYNVSLDVDITNYTVSNVSFEYKESGGTYALIGTHIGDNLTYYHNATWDTVKERDDKYPFSLRAKIYVNNGTIITLTSTNLYINNTVPTITMESNHKSDGKYEPPRKTPWKIRVNNATSAKIKFDKRQYSMTEISEDIFQYKGNLPEKKYATITITASDAITTDDQTYTLNDVTIEGDDGWKSYYFLEDELEGDTGIVWLLLIILGIWWYYKKKK